MIFLAAVVVTGTVLVQPNKDWTALKITPVVASKACHAPCRPPWKTGVPGTRQADPPGFKR